MFSFPLQSIPGIWPLLEKQIFSINECSQGYEFIQAELFYPTPAISYLTDSQVRILYRMHPRLVPRLLLEPEYNNHSLDVSWHSSHSVVYLLHKHHKFQYRSSRTPIIV